MKSLILPGLYIVAFMSVAQTPATVQLSKAVLRDKIKGGWAGQTIGVTFGGPYEFRFCGTMIQDYVPLEWHKGYVRDVMINTPGLYDDIYMDLTFVDVLERKGLDATANDFGEAYAHAGYTLWHANQAGRYNILHGINPPESGNWINNPHADCIDYQIESDFAGLMSPGLPATAASISDRVGHLMNYGDGWYGGVFMSTLYTQAFISSDIPHIISEALKAIPEQAKFHKVISDVIRWHQQYPDDWRSTWFEIQKKWSEDISCPDGVFVPFDIDATVNAAYVVNALLYGNGDFTKTLEIATRQGQDADCNPSSAGGILGCLLGYSKIPAYWKDGLEGAEGLDFKYTTMSLNEVYETSYQHALKVIQKAGGSTEGDNVTIPATPPVPVKFEQSFPGLVPVKKIDVNKTLADEYSFAFEGTGFVIRGESARWDDHSDYIGKCELYVDGTKVETADLPDDYTLRRLELFWKYQLPKKSHDVRIKLLNPDKEHPIDITDIIVYSN